MPRNVVWFYCTFIPSLPFLPLPLHNAALQSPPAALRGQAPRYCPVLSSKNTLRELHFNHQQLQKSVQGSATGFFTTSGPYPAFRDRLDSRSTYSVLSF